MTRTNLAAVAALLALTNLVPTLPATAAAFFGWQVADVANNDVLNVRAFPASTSTILVGYPAGTPLSLTGRCTKGLHLDSVNGQPAASQRAAVRLRWCEVWVDPLSNGNFRTGWVYGRYIAPL